MNKQNSLPEGVGTRRELVYRFLSVDESLRPYQLVKKAAELGVQLWGGDASKYRAGWFRSIGKEPPSLPKGTTDRVSQIYDFSNRNGVVKQVVSGLEDVLNFARAVKSVGGRKNALEIINLFSE